MGTCNSCSPPENCKSKTIAELTRLAPLVLHAKVVAIDNTTSQQLEYSATLDVTHVYKGELKLTQIEVEGFGDTAACRSEVSVGDSRIFFLNVNPFKARYDDLSSAVATNSSMVFGEFLKGCVIQMQQVGSNPHDRFLYGLIYSHTITFYLE